MTNSIPVDDTLPREKCIAPHIGLGCLEGNTFVAEVVQWLEQVSPVTKCRFDSYPLLVPKPHKGNSMHLQTNETESRVHLSHFMYLVSAYEPSKERVEDLADSLLEAIEDAKREVKSIIVDQDCNEHFFVVHPSGTISLCARMRDYKLVEEIV